MVSLVEGIGACRYLEYLWWGLWCFPWCFGYGCIFCGRHCDGHVAIFPASVSGLDLCCALSDLSAEVVDFVVGGGIADVCEVVET